MIRVITWLITHSIFRSLQTTGLDPEPTNGPSLVVATHFGGFADPVMLLSVLHRTPRFLAKSTLWDAFWLAPILNLVRAIPVYRAQDGGTEANAATFTAATAALQQGHSIAIFPEGFANDDPGLHPLKTGAARLAIDAYVEGVRGMKIVPFCGQYERKTRMRTRAWLAQGRSMSVDESLASIAVELGVGIESITSDDREAVRMLTARITASMESIAPIFESEESAVTLLRATSGLDDGSGPGFVLARTAACELARLVRTSGSSGPEATNIARPRHSIFGRLLAIIVLAPVAFVGVVANLIPWGIVAIGRALRDAPVKEVTINVFVAPLVFPLAWLISGLVGWINCGPGAGLLVLVGVPLTGAVTCFWWRQAQMVARR